MSRSLELLKEDRRHLLHLLENVELSQTERTVFQSLQLQIEERIKASEKPN